MEYIYNSTIQSLLCWQFGVLLILSIMRWNSSLLHLYLIIAWWRCPWIILLHLLTMSMNRTGGICIPMLMLNVPKIRSWISLLHLCLSMSIAISGWRWRHQIPLTMSHIVGSRRISLLMLNGYLSWWIRLPG